MQTKRLVLGYNWNWNQLLIFMMFDVLFIMVKPNIIAGWVGLSDSYLGGPGFKPRVP
jgi:hypothetical protein